MSEQLIQAILTKVYDQNLTVEQLNILNRQNKDQLKLLEASGEGDDIIRLNNNIGAYETMIQIMRDKKSEDEIRDELSNIDEGALKQFLEDVEKFAPMALSKPHLKSKRRKSKRRRR